MSDNQKFKIPLPDGKVFQFRGQKLMERTSREANISRNNRWVNLTLYRSREELLVLVVEYDSELSNPAEKEKRQVHVEKLKNWEDFAKFVDDYDFMQHVHLDYYCLGHCTLMVGVPVKNAKLRHGFRRFALDFFEDCHRDDSKAMQKARWDLMWR